MDIKIEIVGKITPKPGEIYFIKLDAPPSMCESFAARLADAKKHTPALQEVGFIIIGGSGSSIQIGGAALASTDNESKG